MQRFLVLLFWISFCPVTAHAQDGFLEGFATKWQARATATQAKQPRWAVPMISPFPMLAQVFRTDFTRQITPAGYRNWNLGSGRGFNLIPCANTQVDILLPGYRLHGDGSPDGFGDTAFLVKYRFLSANENQGSYILSGAVLWTVPTGSYNNGASSAVITPSILAGKGVGRFAFMTSFGAGLPTSHTETAGRVLHSNTVAQYHAGKYLWPEMELNLASYLGGSRDGKTQMFLTPGLLLGRFALKPSDPKSRLGLVGGVAFQSAVTNFHTYNHAAVASVRFAF